LAEEEPAVAAVAVVRATLLTWGEYST
jgi:hypothetical protein